MRFSDKLAMSRFLSFAAVGGLATALHWLITAALVASGALPAVLASTVGFACSAAFNFLANARYTFGAGPVRARQVLRFSVAAGSGAALNALILALGLHGGLPLPMAQAGATLAVLFWNFALNALWVFDGAPAR